MPRSAFFPAPGGKSLWSIVNVTFRGAIYTNQLHLIDQTNDDPRKAQEGRGLVGGISIRNRNTTRICRATVDEQCLLERSSDACVNMLMDKILAQDAAAAAGTAPRTQQPLLLALPWQGWCCWQRLWQRCCWCAGTDAAQRSSSCSLWLQTAANHLTLQAGVHKNVSWTQQQTDWSTWHASSRVGTKR